MDINDLLGTNDNRLKSVHIGARITPNMKAEIIKFAASAGVNVSQFLAFVIGDFLKRQGVIDFPDTKTYQAIIKGLEGEKNVLKGEINHLEENLENVSELVEDIKSRLNAANKYLEDNEIGIREGIFGKSGEVVQF